MNHVRHPKYTPVEKVLIVVLCLLCIGSFVWFFFNIQAYSKAGELHPYRHAQSIAQPRQNIPVSSIGTWMTFDYVNVVFGLDPEYLQNKLDINDPRYPNIRIDGYARRHSLNSQTLLQTIQQLITQHSLQ